MECENRREKEKLLSQSTEKESQRDRTGGVKKVSFFINCTQIFLNISQTYRIFDSRYGYPV